MESRYHWGSWARQAPFVGRGGAGRQLMGSFALLLGFAFSGWAAAELLEWSQLRRWPAVRGVVTQSVVVEERVATRIGKWGSDPVFAPRLRLRYDYEVNGRRYEGTRVDQLPVVRRRAQADRDRYPRGQAVEVRYAPEDPARSLLEVTTPRAAVVGLPGGLLLLMLAARLLRRPPRPEKRRRDGAAGALDPPEVVAVKVPIRGEA